MSKHKSYDSLSKDAARDKAALAIFACQRLILLNYQLYYSGCPVKLYAEMETEKDNELFLGFLRTLNDEKITDLSDIADFLGYK